MARNAHSGGGGGGGDRGNGGGRGQAGGWSQEIAWGAGNYGEVKEGAGQTLVHETHAPKRISHIQFGLLNAEVRSDHMQQVCYTILLVDCPTASCALRVYEGASL